MYSFVDIRENPKIRTLPSEALFFDGQYIEKMIPGYRTLSVSGREFLPYSVDTLKIPGRAGERIRRYGLGSRRIDVEFELQSRSARELLAKMDKLKEHLIRPGLAQFSFYDETQWIYRGVITEIPPPPPGELNFNSSFRIYCPDPYKYTKLLRTGVASSGSVLNIKVPNLIDIYVPRMEIEMRPILAPIHTILVKNETTGKNITIMPSPANKEFYYNRTVEIDLKEGIHASIKGIDMNIDNDIVFNQTDFDFKLNPADDISLRGGGVLWIDYQRRWL